MNSHRNVVPLLLAIFGSGLLLWSASPADAGGCVPIQSDDVSDVAGTLTVGDIETGSYALTTIDCDENRNIVRIGDDVGSNGTLEVSGGAALTTSTLFEVGGDGIGVANLSSGGTVNASAMVIGAGTILQSPPMAASGTVNIDNATLNGPLFVGVYAPGFLNVNSGGLVDLGAGILTVGVSLGAGAVNVLGGIVQSQNRAIIGQDLPASAINVSAGGTLDIGVGNTGGLTIGDVNGGFASLSASGTGSSVTIGGGIIMGEKSVSETSILVEDGAILTTRGGSFPKRGTGTITVRGTNSQFISNGTLPFASPVFSGSSTTILIEDGGLFQYTDPTFAFMELGKISNTNSTLTIRDATSVLDMIFVIVGQSSNASIVLDGGTLAVDTFARFRSNGNLSGSGLVDGELELMSGSDLSLKIDGDVSADQIDVTGDASVTGRVNIAFDSVPTPGSEFDVLVVGGTLTFTPSEINYDGLPDGDIVDAVAANDTLTITYLPEPSPAALGIAALGTLMGLRRRTSAPDVTRVSSGSCRHGR